MAFTTARLNAALDEALNGASWIQLHTDDPGGSGTSNVATNVSGRVQVSGGSFDAAAAGATQEEVEFTITSGGETYRDISIWTAETNGTFYASGALTPEETFAGAGTLTVTIDATISNA